MKLGVIAAALAACLALAGCDKCGGIQDINFPGHTSACADSAPRK